MYAVLVTDWLLCGIAVWVYLAHDFGKATVRDLYAVPVVVAIWPVILCTILWTWLRANDNLIIWEKKHHAPKVTLIRRGGRRR